MLLYDSILAFFGGDHSFTIHLSAFLGGDHYFTIHISAFLGGCPTSSRGPGGRILAFLGGRSEPTTNSPVILQGLSPAFLGGIRPPEEGLEAESLD